MLVVLIDWNLESAGDEREHKITQHTHVGLLMTMLEPDIMCISKVVIYFKSMTVMTVMVTMNGKSIFNNSVEWMLEPVSTQLS